VFEITGASDKIESFVALMLPIGLVEVSRTGIVAIARGPEGMSITMASSFEARAEREPRRIPSAWGVALRGTPLARTSGRRIGVTPLNAPPLAAADDRPA
jgi:hypothetical protein